MSTDHVDEYGPVLHGHDAGDLEGVVQPVVLRPRHELDLGVRLDVAVHHAGQPARDDLRGGGLVIQWRRENSRQ